MGTEIQSNGSRWAGQLPGSLDDLVTMLETHPLDRSFETYGNFITRPIIAEDFLKPESEFAQAHAGFVHFHGNFFTYSHVFSIYTDEPEVIERLTAAIRANQQRPDYMAQDWPEKSAMVHDTRDRSATYRTVTLFAGRLCAMIDGAAVPVRYARRSDPLPRRFSDTDMVTMA